MKKLYILALFTFISITLLFSSQSKPSRTFVLKKCSHKSKTTLTLIDSDGDGKYDEAIEKLCGKKTITLPVVIKTKYHNDPVPEKGDIAIDFNVCNNSEMSTCDKLRKDQGLMSDTEMSNKDELSFDLTFFDVDNNVTALAKQKCNIDTLFVTGAMCNIKWGDE